MKVLSTYSKPEEANLAASYLRANGIFCAVQDENTVNQYWLYSNAVGGVKLEVAEADFERAREALELPAEEGIILECPHCGSVNTKMRDLSVLTASVLLFLGFILPSPSVTVDCRDCRKTFTHRYTKTEPD